MKRLLSLALFVLLTLSSAISFGQGSVAREFNEILLNAIRNDISRPTVHARNLFHTSIVMYDAWAVYEEEHETYFLGNGLGEFVCPFDGISAQSDVELAQETTLAFAMYRLVRHRFQNSTTAGPQTNFFLNQKMEELGLDPDFTDTDYSTGSAAALGNYLGQQMINFGATDYANEDIDYGNLHYEPVNDSLRMSRINDLTGDFIQYPGNPTLVDPNRWQPLHFEVFIPQSATDTIGDFIPEFLNPEWGSVVSFALSEDDLSVYPDGDFDYKVYHDPGPPPYLTQGVGLGMDDPFTYGMVQVIIWSSHMKDDGVLVDISPASLGNLDINTFPTDHNSYGNFYDLFNGGDLGGGYDVNPVTGMPYEPQYVKRSDYSRVLAEFWADGPDSETPPGHWFTLLNYVSDHPDFEKKWRGKGEILDDLEWDVKSYLLMGGGMHDAAVAAWGVKGYYDFIRPVSAIRWMGDQGQCTDPDLPSYSPDGLPLIQDYIELVDEFDPLAGEENENVGKIKVKAWKGPAYIDDPEEDVAGADWILSEFWWPYQRPTFITPPFAGYVSGHSTYSRAAAEIMTLMTGDAYFPGGMGEFNAEQNEYLVFEDGPSEDVVLQWATYRDASDQCSLSRIWGGIHPPCDDIPGRFIGFEIGHDAFAFAESIMDTKGPEVLSIIPNFETIGQNEISEMLTLTIHFDEAVDTLVMPQISFPDVDPTLDNLTFVEGVWTDCDEYVLSYMIDGLGTVESSIDVSVSGLMDNVGNAQIEFTGEEVFILDFVSPSIVDMNIAQEVYTDEEAMNSNFGVLVTFDEMMDMNSIPNISFSVNGLEESTLVLNEGMSMWIDNQNYTAVYDFTDNNELTEDIVIMAIGGSDLSGNIAPEYSSLFMFDIDTENPEVMSVETSGVLNDPTIADDFTITVTFSEEMDMASTPILDFPVENPLTSLTLSAEEWTDGMTYVYSFDGSDINEEIDDIDVSISLAEDANGNVQLSNVSSDNFDIDTKNPSVLVNSANTYVVHDDFIGSATFEMLLIFDEDMDESSTPDISFPVESPSSLTFNTGASSWLNPTTYEAVFDVENIEETLLDIDVSIASAKDQNDNPQEVILFSDFFDIAITLVGIDEEDPFFSEAKLYPNPVHGGMDLTLEFKQQLGNVSWEILDQNGRLVSNSLNSMSSGTRLTIPSNNLANGVYLLLVKSNEANKVFKFEVN